MMLFKRLVLPLALTFMFGACGGSEKKTEKVETPIESAEPGDSTESSDASAGEQGTIEGDDIDSDPLPNPCKGGG